MEMKICGREKWRVHISEILYKVVVRSGKTKRQSTGDGGRGGSENKRKNRYFYKKFKLLVSTHPVPLKW